MPITPRFNMPPFGLLRFHGAMARSAGRIMLRAMFPVQKPSGPATAPIIQIIPAPAQPLLDHYHNWCAARERCHDSIAPHMVAQWGLPLIARILLQTSCPVHEVLNQGVTMRIHGPLPRNRELHCRAFLHAISTHGERTRIAVAVHTGTAEQPDLVETIVHMVIMHQKIPGSGPPSIREPVWQSRGSWRAADNDGLLFALITGDFNPIHWFSPAGRLSALNGKILQGFGSFARTFEQLDANRIREIDVRFLRPVALPSQVLQVEQALQQENGSFRLRLIGPDNQLHLAGTVRYARTD